MNEQNKLDRDIARLIDGELSADETTAVLQQCEDQPEAWRTLALGMLEAREVQLALSDMLVEQPPESTQVPAAKSGRSLTWVLAAACLACIAFLAGRFVPNTTPSGGGGKSSLVTNADGSNPPSVESTEEPQEPGGLTVVGFARIHNLVGQQAPVPVITGPDLDYHALLREPVRVPDELARRCRNEGLAIQTTRRVMALELADGQKFAVPLNQFGFRYVGNKVL